VLSRVISCNAENVQPTIKKLSSADISRRERRLPHAENSTAIMVGMLLFYCHVAARSNDFSERWRREFGLVRLYAPLGDLLVGMADVKALGSEHVVHVWHHFEMREYAPVHLVQPVHGIRAAVCERPNLGSAVLKCTLVSFVFLGDNEQLLAMNISSLARSYMSV
jgi:hypothetical protein